jgi:hypothetical protein
MDSEESRQMHEYSYEGRPGTAPDRAQCVHEQLASVEDLQRTFVVVAPMDSRNSRAMLRSSPSRTKLRLRKSISISLEMALMTCHNI